MNRIVTFPLWLDKIIYEKYGAIYEPRPEQVMFNANKNFDFAKLYLGTYFPRSYAEAYYIFGKLLENKNIYHHFDDVEEMNVLDFCCGTGGEILGLVTILHEKLPKLKRIRIDAFDANSDYISFLFHLNQELRSNINIDVYVNPQCLFIENEQNLNDIVDYTNNLYHIIMSCKALNEFIQHKVFPHDNIYRKIAETFFPCLTNDGVLLLSDLSHKNSELNVFYPEILNSGINSLLRSNKNYKSLYPYSCFFHEHICPGCYMQDIIYVTHSRKQIDVSKIVYRIIGKAEFVTKIMSGISSSQKCKAKNPQADKSLPYQSN